jgi:cell division protein FtsN
VIAAGPEEPVARTSDDPIGAIASTATPAAEQDADDAVADRIAALAAADKAAAVEPTPEIKPEPTPATAPTKASATPTEDSTKPTVSFRSGGALTGTHLVQIGAFKSQEEADGQWAKLQGKLGGYLDGKSNDVERADLGDKGVYYRLRVGPFASSGDAKTYCAGLKERGTDCLIKAK